MRAVPHPTASAPAYHAGAAGLGAQQCHDALRTRDAAHDGRFFVGVTSTRIYCRPVCRVRTPRLQNCRFFDHAAQAEAAGFRPCLRCRPELAPGLRHWSTEDASAILARQAAHWLDAGDPTNDQEAGMDALAAQLGISDRHLRRVFESYWGISPVQYRQTRRLLTAKQLLCDTRLPIAQVAHLAGFASLRRFNDAFSRHYRLTPSVLRKTASPDAATSAPVPCPGDSVSLRLDYRPPLDPMALLDFMRQRALQGVEVVRDDGFARTLQLRGAGARAHTSKGWIDCRFDAAQPRVILTVSASLLPALPSVVHTVRTALDLDADPYSINAVLHASFPHGDGLRVPGAFDGFEVAVRAILGQQVTVAAARTFAQRLVDRFGGHLRMTGPALRLFPRPEVLARATGDALGSLGIVRQRQAAIVALARALTQGDLVLAPMPDDAARLQQVRRQLCALPGVGEWTAEYIAMRVLRDPDAFPAGDVALHRALGLQGQRKAAQAAAEIARAWSPWRSHAVIRSWHQGNDTSKKATQ